MGSLTKPNALKSKVIYLFRIKSQSTMGSDQSTNTTSEIKELPQAEEAPSCSDGGRKASAVVLVEEEPLTISDESLEETQSMVSSSDETYESEDDSDDEEGKQGHCVAALCAELI